MANKQLGDIIYIQHPCNFCGRDVFLSSVSQEHICFCGVRFFYRPTVGNKPGKAAAERQRMKDAI